MTIRRRLLRFVRKLHIWVGLSAALYFMLIAATGVMINHREGLRLPGLLEIVTGLRRAQDRAPTGPAAPCRAHSPARPTIRAP